MIRLNDIIDKVASYRDLSKSDKDLINRAYVYSAKVHAGQKRASGQPYLSHPLEVSSILAEIKLDVATIATGLLHDTVEDTLTTLDEIEELFGRDIAFLVDGTTKISKLHYISNLKTQGENFRKLFLATAQDIRVVLIKLADRLHNMRTLKYLNKDKIKSISEETINVYAPLAHRLGMNWIHIELEDLAFAHSNPRDYKKVHNLVSSKKKEWKNYLKEVKTTLTEKLNEVGIKAEVTGRFKHNYGIYTKMKMQGLDIDKVYDILAFRIITDSKNECYQALGIIHGLWSPVPGKFKDYIALQKANGYQALHTTVLDPLKERMEIQIKTKDMHKYAEYGVASHWNYKENMGANTSQKMYDSLRKLLEHKDIEDSTEFMEAIQGELASQILYVFTPNGDIIELPQGATPMDFAYAIHAEIGHHCYRALVNRGLVALNRKLKTGDTVEIITHKDKHPSRDWLSFVVTSKARTRIRSWLRKEENEVSEESGRNITQRKLKKHGIQLGEIEKDKKLLDSLKTLNLRGVGTLNLDSIEEFYRAVGFGRISASEIINLMSPGTDIMSQGKRDRIKSIINKISKDRLKNAIKIQGFNNIMVRLAECCLPLPGELILGYTTRGKGVTIHKHNCSYLLDVDPERRIDVEWDKDFAGQLLATIFVVYSDIPKKLPKLEKVILKNGANIINVKTFKFDIEKVRSNFEISVENITCLNSIIDSLQKLKSVVAVERIFKSQVNSWQK